MSVKDVDNTEKLLKSLRELYKKDIDVGILSESGGEIIERATHNEFGTENIPERSFIRAGYDHNRKYIETQTEKLTEKVIEGVITPQTACELLGESMKGRIQKYAIALKQPPNGPKTIMAKGSSNPLVDTGQMVQSIAYKVNGWATLILKI